MKAEAHVVYRKNPEVVLRHVAGEALLIPIRRKLSDMDRIFALNQTGETVWELLDGRRTVSEVARLLAARYDVSEPIARDDVAALIEQLCGDGLVERVP